MSSANIHIRPRATDGTTDTIRQVVPDSGAEKRDSSPEISPGTEANHYIIRERIGRGGQAEVYRARDQFACRDVALKVIAKSTNMDDYLGKRFLREAQNLARLKHPNLIEIIELLVVEGRPALAMEFLDGGTLSDTLRRVSVFAPTEILSILDPLCDVLSYIHQLGIVHRDIKPSNIGFLLREQQTVLKLLDFGIAKDIGSDAPEALTRTGQRIGTPTFMAPEQLTGGKIDHRADIYSLGVVLYCMIAGRSPYKRGVYALVNMDPPAPSRFAPVSAAVDAVILRCIASKPDERYSSATEVAAAYRDALGQKDAKRVAVGSVSGDVNVDKFYIRLQVDLGVQDAVGNIDDISDDTLVTYTDIADDLSENLESSGFVVDEQSFGVLLATRYLSQEDLPQECGELVDTACSLRDALFGQKPQLRGKMRITLDVQLPQTSTEGEDVRDAETETEVLALSVSDDELTTHDERIFLTKSFSEVISTSRL